MIARAWILVALAACDVSLHRMQDPVGCRTGFATTLLPGGSCALQPPDGTIIAEPVPREPAITRALLDRGRDRFDRTCAACHGVAGDGDSVVARAMGRRPTSLVDATAAALPDARIAGAMAVGFGAMPRIAWLAPGDRVAILHYVRVLQRREVALDALAPAERTEAVRWLR